MCSLMNIYLILVLSAVSLQSIEALPFLAHIYTPRKNGYNSDGDLLYEIPKDEYTEENFYGVIKVMQNLIQEATNNLMHENNVLSNQSLDNN